MTPEQEKMSIALDKAYFVRVFDDELVYVWNGSQTVNVYDSNWNPVDCFTSNHWLTRTEVNHAIEEHHEQQTE